MIGKVLRKKTEILLLSTIGFLLATWNELGVCQKSYGLGFDQQSFLFWDYAHNLGLIPFKDFFYPYGLIFYLKTNNIFWHAISLALIFLITTSLLLILKKVFKDRTYAYSFFLSYCLFAGIFLSYDSFLRYAPLLLFNFILAIFASKNEFFKNKSGFSLGIFTGLLFSFINDLFFYSFLVFILFMIISLIITRPKENSKSLFIFMIYFSLGFLTGIIPILIFLSRNNLWSDFINNYFILRDISFFAKVPFPPSLKVFENVFTIGLLVISIITFINSFLNKKFNFSFYLKLALTISLIILEQKNIIRSNYQELSIFGIFLFFTFVAEVKEQLNKMKLAKNIIYIFLMNVILLFFTLLANERKISFVDLTLKIPTMNDCLRNKVSKIDKNHLKDYWKVSAFIKKDKKSKAFSFPGDSIFYILLSQNPPYYPSIYEATPISAQEKLIEYIKTSDVKYVIYNKKSSAIQDGVPDIIRAKKLYKFVIENFVSEKRIGTFEILIKK